MTGSEDEPSGTGRRETDSLPATARDYSILSAGFRVDILDRGDRAIVIAELPGADEETIAIRLPNPQTLRITARRAGPAGEGAGDGTLSRLIRLPASVTAEGAATGYRNGVLEVSLKKVEGGSGPGGREIPIG